MIIVMQFVGATEQLLGVYDANPCDTNHHTTKVFEECHASLADACLAPVGHAGATSKGTYAPVWVTGASWRHTYSGKDCCRSDSKLEYFEQL
ncbi:MAG: hypothetical protein ABL921_32615, partial [Pirellula sp.]